MARMLGRFTAKGCWSGGRESGRPCIRAGPDCSGWDRSTRWRKRVKQRQLERDLNGECWQCGTPYSSTEEGCDACDA